MDGEPQDGANSRVRPSDELADHADKRADPRTLLPTARSVIVIAVAYPAFANVEDAAPGRVAALFAGRDYHRVVRDILA